MKQLFIFSIALWLFSCSAPQKDTDPFVDLTMEEREALAKDYFQRIYGPSQVSAYQNRMLDTAVLLDPTHAEAWFELAAAAIKQGDYVNAFYYYDKAAEHDPKQFQGWRANIRLYYLKDYEKAIEDYVDYLKLFPEHQLMAARGDDVHFSMGKAFWGMGNYQSAVDSISHYIDITTAEQGEDWVEVYAFIYRGRSYQALGDYSNALIDYEKAIQYFSNCVEAYYHRAEILAEQVKKEDACKAAQQALESARKGYIKSDGYREVFGQLYMEDVEDLVSRLCSGQTQ
ncbi:MAG: tetratricopeptide repeat protein [Bacteroidota bacterium]